MSKISRRSFGSAAAAVLAASKVGAQTKKNTPITSASVPGDPVAPQVSQGTQPAFEPFGSIGVFTRRDVAVRVTPFQLTDVKLTSGEFLDAQEANREYLLSLPPERLLHTFRVNAGLTSNAEPLGGWEKPDCELRGHFIGHYLSACALMYAATGDQVLKQKADLLVAGLAECQDKLSGGGYLSAFPIELFDRLRNRKKVWAPFYTIHKIMAGMVDMHELCGNQQALTVVKGMAAWVDDWTKPLTEEQMQMVLDTEYGGMNDVLYLLAWITGDAHYGTVGDRFTKKRFFDPLATRRDELRGLHVNTHIPQVIGAARRYQLTGDPRFREVSEYFYSEVTTARAYVTGGTSNNEGWLTGPNRLADELKQGTDTTECCCAYNMMKLARMLYQQTADPRYFDYYERTLYNHRLGTIQKNGAMQYYLGIVPGAWRTFSTKDTCFWCCDGTGVEEYSKLADSIYFHDQNGVYVNLFIPSTLKWREKIELRQETSFPDSPRTRIIVETPGTLALHLRIPDWISGPALVKLNGKSLDLEASRGSYLTIRRDWVKGDTVEMELPMALRYEAMPDDEGLRAVMLGPLVLAGGLGNDAITEPMVNGPAGPEMKKHPGPKIPDLDVASKLPSEWLRAKAKPLTFVTTGQPSPIEFAPLHRTSGQRYSIYWRMSQTSEI